eukprot:m.62214 g.62214  ORF g.62214 m.62214 type:complete len:295 (-) comp19346_c0_seq1:44-928(-)
MDLGWQTTFITISNLDWYCKIHTLGHSHKTQHCAFFALAVFFYSSIFKSVMLEGVILISPFPQDILFDACKHQVKKFVVHSNFPGHFDFQRYWKCFFRITVPSSKTFLSPHAKFILEPNQPELSTSEPETEQDQLGDLDSIPLSDSTAGHPDMATGMWRGAVVDTQPGATLNQEDQLDFDKLSSVDLSSPSLDHAVDDTPLAVPQPRPSVLTSSSLRHESEPNKPTFEVTADSQWEEIQAHTSDACGQPVAFQRAPAANTTNPFGATLFWGFRNLIFEVMGNGHLASVTMFPPS